MKRCIIALLLGFNEVETFKKRYSHPKASVTTKHFLPHLTKPKEFITSPLDYDLVTIFHIKQTFFSSKREARYEYSIAISLLEPLVDELDAHDASFNYVKNFLTSIPNWFQGFKIIIRHHSYRGAREVRFDHKLMQERFVPDSHVHGFQAERTYDARDQSRRPITADQAKIVSAEITKRTAHQLPLRVLASWVNKFIPSEPMFARQHFNADNPLRITMGGCYSGLSDGVESLIENFLFALSSSYFQSSFVVVIGAISWTFYDDWRAISLCEQYLDRASNIDPLRGVALNTEQNFFVKIPNETRRYHTKEVVWNPQTQTLTYGLRPLKAQSRQMQSMKPQTSILMVENAKAVLSDLLMDLFLSFSGGHMRVPENISRVLQNIDTMISPAMTVTQLITNLKLCLSQLSIPGDSAEANVFFNQFVEKARNLIQYVIFWIIDARDGAQYSNICSRFEHMRNWIEALPRVFRQKYVDIFEIFKEKIARLKRMPDRDEGEYPESMYTNASEFTSFLKNELGDRTLDEILLDEKAYFRPLIVFLNDFEQAFVNPLIDQVKDLKPFPIEAVQIMRTFEGMRKELETYLLSLK